MAGPGIDIRGIGARNPGQLARRIISNCNAARAGAVHRQVAGRAVQVLHIAFEAAHRIIGNRGRADTGPARKVRSPAKIVIAVSHKVCRCPLTNGGQVAGVVHIVEKHIVGMHHLGQSPRGVVRQISVFHYSFIDDCKFGPSYTIRQYPNRTVFDLDTPIMCRRVPVHQLIIFLKKFDHFCVKN